MMVLLRSWRIAASLRVRAWIGFKLSPAILGTKVVDLPVMDGGLRLRNLHIHVTDGIDSSAGRRGELTVTGGQIVSISARVGVVMPMSHDVRAAAKAHHHEE
jgi:hypothetical protein